jgi:REase_MTES_1575
MCKSRCCATLIQWPGRACALLRVELTRPAEGNYRRPPPGRVSFREHGGVVEGPLRVRVLKEFLEYATRGAFTPGRQSGEEPDSDFERWFLSRLKSINYEAHPQVGVAKSRIDIGVVHPDKLGSYILGVKCDGATYHSLKSARDRDRLRQDVLETLKLANSPGLVYGLLP